MKTKFSGKRPVMFYQAGKEEYLISHGSRIRIFYPDGSVEWASLSRIAGVGFFFNTIPCWLAGKTFKKIKTAIKAAQKYDTQNAYPEMEFLGEL